jgi:hypothetical protein
LSQGKGVFEHRLWVNNVSVTPTFTGFSGADLYSDGVRENGDIASDVVLRLTLKRLLAALLHADRARPYERQASNPGHRLSPYFDAASAARIIQVL